MRAIVQSGYGGTDRLRVAEVPDPVPGQGDVLLRVLATSLNGSDRENLAGTPFYARSTNGLRRPRDPVPGSDVAGVVVTVGAEVTEFAPGDEVFGELRGYRGGLAELVATPPDLLARRPAGLSAVEAAAIPQAGCIGLRAVDGVGAGDRVLVNGAGGSGGGFVVGLAKHRGAHVTAVDHGSKAEFLRALGADETVAYEAEEWTTHRGRYDLVVDLVGYRSPFRVNAALAPGGAYRLIGGHTRVLLATLAAGPVLRLFGRRRVGVLVVPQSRATLEQVTALVTEGAVAPVVDSVVPLDEAPAAFARLGSGQTRGKVVVDIAGDG
ncbi:NAD(P)-dependent alcohol dehydrogenase [Actinophytocola gossypii]|uniref:NAD(P)-dependent alcohol dehydrogenase n=1 Tax=Actinophytocola gossypii TaxID=2812003 RepID=A0ABT2JCJ9_9PSEU|nr:NAD(P)-dependent alcohol dehydrogenase [Actinophytocola gossypii]MCT2585575.1 NAD(P)-dependent alcohol dehydrogenase [Actinophytocola gossypii]